METNQLVLSVAKERYDPLVLAWLEKEGTALSLLPVHQTENRDKICLVYPLAGCTPLSELFSRADDQTFFNILRCLTRQLRQLQQHGEIHGLISSSLNEIFWKEDRSWLVCQCVKADQQMLKQCMHAVMQQLRALTYPALHTVRLRELWNMIANPFASVSQLAQWFETHQLEPEQPAAPVVAQEPQDAPKTPGAIPLKEQAAPAKDASDFLQDSSQKIFAQQADLPMNQTMVGFKEGMSILHTSDAPPQFTTLKSSQSSPSGSIRQPDRFSDAASVPRLTLMNDSPVQKMEDIGVTYRAVNLAPQPLEQKAPDVRQLKSQKPLAPKGPENRTPAAKPPSSAAAKPAARPRSAPAEPPVTAETAYAHAVEQCRQERRRWMWTVLKILASLVAAAGLGLLLGALMDWFGIFLAALLEILFVALMIHKGLFNLKWPKMPSAADYAPDAPEISSVFAVRLRLNSVNLASPMELLIRENNQIIGADPVACKVPIQYPGISRKHCQISAVKSAGFTEYTITDLGSHNGTLLNGKPLTPHTPYPIHIGDHLVFAKRYEFEIDADSY